MSTYFLSVDPGQTSSGWALWEDQGDSWSLSTYGLLKQAETGEVWELLGSIAPSWESSEVVVEGQWYAPPSNGRYRSANFRAVERLIESRCTWAVCCELAGATVEIVSPGVWISAMTKGAPGRTPDDRIKNVCRQRWEHKFVADEHAAILLGEYWLTSKRRKISRKGFPVKGQRGVP
jgi:hypothetical protein